MKGYKEYIDEKIKVCLRVPHPFYPLIVFISIVIILGGLFLYYADEAVPGEFFYPLERSMENTRVFLTFNGISRAGVLVNIAAERVFELDQIRQSRISGTEDRGSEILSLKEIDRALEKAVIAVAALEIKYSSTDKLSQVQQLRLLLLEVQAKLAERLQNKDYKLDSSVIENYLKNRQAERKLENPGIRLEDYLK